MRKWVADKWIEALRSGEYEQTKGQLRKCGANWEENPKDSTFCCLGVLCDVYAQEHAEADWGVDLKGCHIDRGSLFMNEEFHLPRAVREWAGMNTENGKLPRYVDVSVSYGDGSNRMVDGDNLVDLNDNGCPFVLIADVIFNHVEEL